MLRRIIFVAGLLLAGSAYAQSVTDPIVTENYSESVVTSNSDSTTTVKSPPPSQSPHLLMALTLTCVRLEFLALFKHKFLASLLVRLSET